MARGPVEEALAALCGAVPDRDQFSAADNFFARGARGIDPRLHRAGDVVRAVEPGVARYRRVRCGALAIGFTDTARVVVEHCDAPDAGHVTPSDLPLFAMLRGRCGLGPVGGSGARGGC